MRAVEWSVMRKQEPFEYGPGEGPSLVVTWRDRGGIQSAILESGIGDDIHMFREDGTTYFLSMNYGIPYVGLEAYDGEEKLGSIYLQEGQVEEVLGEKGLDYTPNYLARFLSEYIPY